MNVGEGVYVISALVASIGVTADSVPCVGLVSEEVGQGPGLDGVEAPVAVGAGRDETDLFRRCAAPLEGLAHGDPLSLFIAGKGFVQLADALGEAVFDDLRQGLDAATTHHLLTLQNQDRRPFAEGESFFAKYPV